MNVYAAQGRWLTGWKAIAWYLDVSERKARYMAKNGMPVLKEGKTIVALSSEIDSWRMHNAGKVRQS